MVAVIEQELAKNRGNNQGGTYRLEGKISRRDCARLDVGEALHSLLGLAAGLPVYLHVGRKKDATDANKTTMRLAIGWSSGCLPGEVDRWTIKPAVSMAACIETSPGPCQKRLNRDAFHDDQNWGYSDFFGCAWETIMGDISPFFDRQGDMKVHVTLSLAK